MNSASEALPMPAVETQSCSTAYRAYVLAALAVVGFMNNVDRVVIYMFLQPIKKEFLLSDTEVGLMSGAAFAIMSGFIAIPLARLADRSNRKKVIAVCFGLWSLFTALCGAASNFATMLAARVGVGIGEAGSPPATHSMLGDYYARDLRSRALAIFTGVTALGGVTGWVGGGVIVQSIGWRNGFFVLGIVGVAMAVIFHLTVREPRRIDAQQHGVAADIGMLAQLGDLRAFVMLATAWALAGFTGAATSWMPSYFARTFALPPVQIGLGLGLTLGFPFALGAIIGGALSVRHVRQSKSWGLRFAAVSTAVALPFFVACFFSPTALPAFGLLFVSMLGFGAATGPVAVAVQDMVSPHARATAIALLAVGLTVVGGGLGPVVIGVISDWMQQVDPSANSLQVGLVSAALPLVLACALYWGVARRIDIYHVEQSHSAVAARTSNP